MNKKILKELAELKEAGVVSESTAENIRQYYQSKSEQGGNRIVVVFGILGALLTGMGIILIIAHNWDDFNTPVKLFFAFMPLVIGQALCGYTLVKKKENTTWRESSAVFLFLAIASSISIVSQVYHISGSLQGFLLTWIILSIPIIYVMRSSMTSLLVISAATWYACEVSYFSYPRVNAWYYWLMMLAIVPWYVRLLKFPKSNFLYFHSWLLALSLTITLGMFGESQDQMMFVAYVSLFSAFILLGELDVFKTEKLITNAFLITGSLGMVIVLLILTVDYPWESIHGSMVTAEIEFFVSIVVSLAAAVLLVVNLKRREVSEVHPMGFVFIVFIVLFVTGLGFPHASQVLTNLLVLVIGVLITKRGADDNNLLIMNYGLLIITALMLIRFFDSDISFVIRGILFIAVGVAFFAFNLRIMKKRKTLQS